MKTASPFRRRFFTLLPAVVAIAATCGCAVGAPTPASPSGPAATNPSPSQPPAQSVSPSPPQAEGKTGGAGAGGRLDPATENLSWADGNRILGAENGGHTPDIGSSLADPTSGWQADYSRMATDGIMTFTSQNTQCKVRTAQMRNQASELVPGDDKASTLKVLSSLFPGEKDLIASAKDATLGYGVAGTRDVDMLSFSFKSGESYDFTAIRTFSKPAVTVQVEALCPTLDTLNSTLSEIRQSIRITAL